MHAAWFVNNENIVNIDHIQNINKNYTEYRIDKIGISMTPLSMIRIVSNQV